jgi:CBS-domain-containing membrane protein
VLNVDDSVETAGRRLLATDLPALPVVDDRQRVRGIFGEREFFHALFPGYLDQLGGARFVTRSLEAALEKRGACRNDAVGDHMNTEHIDVGTDFSDAQVAEVFLHHRALVLPVVGDGARLAGVITRRDFFNTLGRRFVADDR